MKNFQDSLPHSRVTGNSWPELKSLKSSPPGAKIPMARPKISNTKSTSQVTEKKG